MRPDRLITLSLVRPFRRISRKRFGANPLADKSLPVLMYHSISDASESGVSPYYRVNTNYTRFAGQMELLKLEGYQGVTLSAGLAWLNSQPNNSESEGTTSNFRLPLSGARPVAITFDDGFQNFYTEGFSVLKKCGFAATMFLPTAFIGENRRSFRPHGKNNNSRIKTDSDCLTWREVRELHDAGIEFGSHTVNHPRLVELPWTDIELELRNSKREIENQLGTAVETFAYPYAFPETDHAFVRRFSHLLAKIGYRYCATTRLGHVKRDADLLKLKRLPVNSCDDDVLFLAKLHGDYDWLALFQGLIKNLKRAFVSRKRYKARVDEPALNSQA
jgi:peptidoglycan/xylan/chitin deacetylase (PgdA/CDA1 family)